MLLDTKMKARYPTANPSTNSLDIAPKCLTIRSLPQPHFYIMTKQAYEPA